MGFFKDLSDLAKETLGNDGTGVFKFIEQGAQVAKAFEIGLDAGRSGDNQRWQSSGNGGDLFRKHGLPETKRLINAYDMGLDSARYTNQDESVPIPDGDLYAILGVPPSASASDIKSAYRALALKYHPDQNPGHEEKFREIAGAWSILGDARKRAEYDRRRN